MAAVEANIANTPPQRRARRARTPRSGKGSPSLVPSVLPLLSAASVACRSASVVLLPGWPSASPVSGAVEVSSLVSAASGRVLGSVP